MSIISHRPHSNTHVTPTLEHFGMAITGKASEQLTSSRRLESPRILLYSHDTFGLGNIRRTQLLVETLTEEFSQAQCLILTGSPVVHSFTFPKNADYIKLPCLDRIDDERYAPRFLHGNDQSIRRTREAIVRNVVTAFRPDLFIVDKRASGVDGELFDTLTEIRASLPQTKLVLGIRDILDGVEKTRASLTRSQTFRTIEDYYDEVWIYGHPAVFDAVREYGFPDRVARKTHYTGYLRRECVRISRQPSNLPHVLLTTGGGEDGGHIIRAYLEGLRRLPVAAPFHTTVVFGPMLDVAERDSLRELYRGLANVTLIDFDPDLRPYYAQADVVVSMAGYNAVCEFLSWGISAVLVPRSEPVQEQLIRARLLAGQELCEIVEPNSLTPELLIGVVAKAVERADSRTASLVGPRVDLNGIEQIRIRSRRLLSQP